MVPLSFIDRNSKQISFEKFPHDLLDYQENVSEKESNFVSLDIASEQDDQVTTVFVSTSKLQKMGISLTAWKCCNQNPQKLSDLIRIAAQLIPFFERASPIVRDHLSSKYMPFFTDKAFAARAITNALFQNKERSSKIQGMPGFYLLKKNSCQHVVINLKKTTYLGEGTFGKVRKVLWLTAPSENEMIIAKKVARSNYDSYLKNEIETLGNTFSNKKGIISLISGGFFRDKWVAFFPIYECNLSQYCKSLPFPMTLDEKCSLIANWLEGLATISEEGIHGDLSSGNLLLRKKAKIEGVISDFGSYRPHNKAQYGLTTVTYGSPEYFEKKEVTSKLDVWSMGLSLQRIFAKKRPVCFDFVSENDAKDTAKMKAWSSKLLPNWILEDFFQSDTPPFLMDLINKMLDPRPVERLSAVDAFELFSKGYSAFTASR